MISYLKKGSVGKWTVEDFKLTEDAVKLNNLRYLLGSERGILEADVYYTRLVHEDRKIVMSDTPAELRDLMEFRARTRMMNLLKPVHIDGLGLGICTYIALQAGADVEVVEIDQDVCKLVGDQLMELYPESLTVINADALTFKPTRRYSLVWHDIWDDVCDDNLPEYHRLHRKWGRWCDWQGSWAYDDLRRRR